MGLHAYIFRDGYDSRANLFHGKTMVTLVNLDGPFDPTPDAPAALVDVGPYGDPIIVPDYQDRPPGLTHAGPMFGGTFAHSSDSRFGRGVTKATGVRSGRFGFHAALPVHDRFDTWADYYTLTSD